MLRVLTFTTLFPSSVRPGHGIFVETRLRELLRSGRVESRVVAPVPWFFSGHPKFGEYALGAKTPLRETRNGLDVQHPRYVLLPQVGMTLAPFTLALGARGAIQRLLDEGFDFDVIDAHYYYPDGVAAALLARHFNKPLTITARGSDINLVAHHIIPRRLMLWASRRASASIVVSSALKHAMRNIGMAPTCVLVMPNGVDARRFHLRPQHAARAELGWPDAPTLLSVGNLVENKGHHLVIEALTHMPQFRLVIAGDGPQRRALETLVARSNLASRVQFMGSVDQAQLATCYCAADVLVLASSREGWPNVLLESMACGTPVVATRVGGVPEIVTSNRVGQLMESRTVGDLVDAVTRLWVNLPDRANVRARAQELSWDSTTNAQLAVFDQIASGRRESAHG